MRGYGTPPATATPLEAYTRLVKDGRLAPDEGQTVVMKKLQVMTPEQWIVSHARHQWRLKLGLWFVCVR